MGSFYAFEPARPTQVRAFRAKHGLTQLQLANVLGKTVRSVKAYEADTPLPAADWLLLRLLSGETTPAQARAETLFPTRKRPRRSPK